MAAATDEEMAEYMEETRTIQDLLINHDFYMIDAKVEEVANIKPLISYWLIPNVIFINGRASVHARQMSFSNQ